MARLSPAARAGLSAEPLMHALDSAGLRVGVRERLRLHAVFEAQPALHDREHLLSVLRAALVCSDEDRRVFDRVAPAWFDGAEVALTQPARRALRVVPGPVGLDGKRDVPEPTRWGRTWFERMRRDAARGYAVLRAAAGGAWRAFRALPWRVALALAALGAASAVLFGLLAERWGWSQPTRPVGPAYSITMAVAVVATLVVLVCLRWRAMQERAGSGVTVVDIPPRWRPSRAAAQLALLERRDQETLVWGLEHFVSDEPTLRLDLPATVRATARAGGIAQPQYQRARHVREVWLWLDESTTDLGAARLAGEIETSLRAHGLPVERAAFWALPDELCPADGGRSFGPNEQDERRDGTLVAIFTDGRLLLRQHAMDTRRVAIEALLRELSHWPRLAFVDLARSREFEHLLTAFNLTLVPPERLAAHLGAALSTTTGTPRDSAREVAWSREATLWAGACCLGPGGLVDDATALELGRCLSISPWALPWLQARLPTSGRQLTWSARHAVPVLARLALTEPCDTFDTSAPDARARRLAEAGVIASGSLLDRALAFWERRYDSQKPDAQTDLDGADAAVRIRWRAERALLRVWRQPEAAARELHALFSEPLSASIRSYLEQLAPADDPAAASRARLPWRWLEVPDESAARLRAMGLGESRPGDRLRAPGRIWLALGTCALVTAFAAGVPEAMYLGALVLAGVLAWRTPAWRAWLLRLTRAADVRELWPFGGQTPESRNRPTTAAATPHENESDLQGRGAAARVPIEGEPPPEHASASGDMGEGDEESESVASTQAEGVGREPTVDPAPRATNPPRPAMDPPLDLPSGIKALEPYVFTVARVDEHGVITEKRQAAAWSFSERLRDDVRLDMTYIPGGRFLMGSPADEKDRGGAEGPQHEVVLEPFFLGMLPVTQAQWRAVAQLPKVQRDLAPDPSHFKGVGRPVECVSWHDAVEFCARLSRHTGRAYRLPSEAQWEYACRAGTDTPFHFGPTLTPEIANYHGNYPYGAASKGLYRQQTTDAGAFGVANDFGVFDLHGNVWEWCRDPWHRDYNDAPLDGRAWEVGGDDSRRVARGGSWLNLALYCRSAYRLRREPGGRGSSIGFRVLCVLSRTL